MKGISDIDLTEKHFFTRGCKIKIMSKKKKKSKSKSKSKSKFKNTHIHTQIVKKKKKKKMNTTTTTTTKKYMWRSWKILPTQPKPSSKTFDQYLAESLGLSRAWLSHRPITNTALCAIWRILHSSNGVG